MNIYLAIKAIIRSSVFFTLMVSMCGCDKAREQLLSYTGIPSCSNSVVNKINPSKRLVRSDVMVFDIKHVDRSCQRHIEGYLSTVDDMSVDGCRIVVDQFGSCAYSFLGRSVVVERLPRDSMGNLQYVVETW